MWAFRHRAPVSSMVGALKVFAKVLDDLRPAGRGVTADSENLDQLEIFFSLMIDRY
jgi:hypothetical protein